MLQRAVASVNRQSLHPSHLILQFDVDGDGAAVTRQRGLEQVTTEWTAFLDDDDEFEDFHLEHLMFTALLVGADLVHSAFTVVHPFGKTVPVNAGPFQPERPHWSSSAITTLVRTEAALEVGGFLDEGVDTKAERGEDRRFMERFYASGHPIQFHNERTWRYYWFHQDGPEA